MQTRKVALSDLRPDPANEKDHSDEKHRETLRASLKDFNQVEPLVCRAGTNTLIGGHGRLEIMSELGWQEAWVVDFEGTDEEVAALRVVLNRSAELSGWNPEALHRTLQMLKTKSYDLKRIGFTMPDLRAIGVKAHQRKVGKAVDPGAGALPKEPVSKPGEVYQLGPHRLICGDSSDEQVHNELLGGGARYGVWWTDPPYGVDYEGTAGKIQNDNLSEEALQKLLEASLGHTLKRSRPGAAVYVAAPSGPLFHVFGSVLKPMGVWRQTLAWNKNALVMGRSDYHYKHESIFYGWVPGSAHHWGGDRKQSTVLDVDKPRSNPDHPTMKPPELIVRCLANSARPDDLVVDPFGGSGSTLIAAAMQGLSARLIELDPRFCDVIRRRWTGYAIDAGLDPGKGALK